MAHRLTRIRNYSLHQLFATENSHTTALLLSVLIRVPSVVKENLYSR